MEEKRNTLGHIRIGKSERRGEVRRANDRIESAHSHQYAASMHRIILSAFIHKYAGIKNVRFIPKYKEFRLT